MRRPIKLNHNHLCCHFLQKPEGVKWQTLWISAYRSSVFLKDKKEKRASLISLHCSDGEQRIKKGKARRRSVVQQRRWGRDCFPGEDTQDVWTFLAPAICISPARTRCHFEFQRKVNRIKTRFTKAQLVRKCARELENKLASRGFVLCHGSFAQLIANAVSGQK